MTCQFFHLASRIARPALAFVLAGSLAACATPPASHPPEEAYDPYETSNRKNHEFNKALDRSVLRPVGRGYAAFMPDDIEDGIGRFATNLSIPGAVVNNILQGNMRGAFQDTARFTVNSTVGLLGVFDPATEMNMAEGTDADFGQTLYVWGASEGAYIELPFLGPATERATYGKIVDLFTNPLDYVLDEPERYYGTAASISTGLSNRGRYTDTIDSILYESADSYSQAKSLYIQNRRFKVEGGSAGGFTDPYDSPFSAALEDPYDQ